MRFSEPGETLRLTAGSPPVCDMSVPTPEEGRRSPSLAVMPWPLREGGLLFVVPGIEAAALLEAVTCGMAVL